MADTQGHGTHPGHGNTPAAWTTVTIILVGSTIAGIAVILGDWWMFLASAVGLPLLGLVVGRIMAGLGLGGTPTRRHDRTEVEASTPGSSAEGIGS
jgi:hypothetical protein